MTIVTIFLLALSHFCCFSSASKPFEDETELQEQLIKYCHHPTSYDDTEYGKIEEWNVSRITNMVMLFDKELTCNPNIAAWDVSAVTCFHSMFVDAKAFNQDIGGWNVSSVTDFDYMFDGATSFNQNIAGWNVSSGKEFNGMFLGATSFNQDLGGWDVSSGTNFGFMFDGATSFHQNLTSWPLLAKESTAFCNGGICNASPSTTNSPHFVNVLIIGLVLSSFVRFSFYFYKRRNVGRGSSDLDLEDGDEGVQLPTLSSATKATQDYDYIPLQENLLS